MDQLIEFTSNHWALSLAFLVIAALLLRQLSQDSANNRNIGSAQAIQLINQHNAKLIDVRAEDDFKQGHIADAIHLPMSDIKNKHKKIGDVNQAIIVVCARGHSAQTAAKQFAELGFNNVSVLRGGIEGWKTDNLPLFT